MAVKLQARLAMARWDPGMHRKPDGPRNTKGGPVSAGAPVFVLGGAQTDFTRSWSREGVDLASMIAEPVQGALVDAGVDATDIEVGHVANFAAEIYCGQGHLGGLLVEADPAFAGLPTSRHEAACASGSVAVLAAMADIEAERYDVACVVGVEMMRNVPSRDAVSNLGAAAWVPYETDGVPMVWPEVFAALGDEYERRYGLEAEHLAALARNSFENARRNPNAQTRGLGPAGGCVRTRTSTTTRSSPAGCAGTTARRSPTAVPR